MLHISSWRYTLQHQRKLQKILIFWSDYSSSDVKAFCALFSQSTTHCLPPRPLRCQIQLRSCYKQAPGVPPIFCMQKHSLKPPPSTDWANDSVEKCIKGFPAVLSKIRWILGRIQIFGSANHTQPITHQFQRRFQPRSRSKTHWITKEIARNPPLCNAQNWRVFWRGFPC